MSKVESSVIVLGEAMQEVTTLTHQRFEDNEKESKSILGALQNLFATIGPTMEIDATLEAPTLWGTTAFIAEDVVRLGGVVEGLDAELKPMGDAIKAVEDANDKSMSKVALSENSLIDAM